MSLRIGDVVRLNNDAACITLMNEAEVIYTPAGEGDVWGFKELPTGRLLYTSERFTAHVLRRTPLFPGRVGSVIDFVRELVAYTAPASGVAVVTEAMVEIGARAVCAHMGCDADEPATYERSRKKCCRPDGSVILQWELHAPEVRAALEAALGAREGSQA